MQKMAQVFVKLCAINTVTSNTEHLRHRAGAVAGSPSPDGRNRASRPRIGEVSGLAIRRKFRVARPLPPRDDPDRQARAQSRCSGHRRVPPPRSGPGKRTTMIPYDVPSTGRCCASRTCYERRRSVAGRARARMAVAQLRTSALAGRGGRPRGLERVPLPAPVQTPGGTEPQEVRPVPHPGARQGSAREIAQRAGCRVRLGSCRGPAGCTTCS